jgi:hypothetical protein
MIIRSNDLLDFEKKNNSFILYQKKVESGDQTKKPVYEYYIEKTKIKGEENGKSV